MSKHRSHETVGQILGRRENLSRLIGIPVLMSLIGGGAWAVADVHDRLTQPLPAPETQPGADIAVTDQAKALLRDATVAISRQNQDTIRTGRICTGTKIQDADQTYILTAAHCFGQDMALQTNNQDAPPDVTNIIESLPATYFITDATPAFGNPVDETSPVATVTGVATSTSSDWAVLSVKVEAAAEALYSDIAALPSSQYTALTTAAPAAGAQVALSSLPQVTDRLLLTDGTYVGRAESKNPAAPGTYDLVGLKEMTPRENPCNRGGSGSQAVTAHGWITGPLAFGDAQPLTPDAAAAFGKRYNFPVDTSAFNSFCAYSVMRNITDISLYTAALPG